jgi:hypothetical protein
MEHEKNDGKGRSFRVTIPQYQLDLLENSLRRNGTLDWCDGIPPTVITEFLHAATDHAFRKLEGKI